MKGKIEIMTTDVVNSSQELSNCYMIESSFNGFHKYFHSSDKGRKSNPSTTRQKNTIIPIIPI